MFVTAVCAHFLLSYDGHEEELLRYGGPVLLAWVEIFSPLIGTNSETLKSSRVLNISCRIFSTHYLLKKTPAQKLPRQ